MTRLQARFWRLVKEHSHIVPQAVTGLSALPETAFASPRVMSRFLHNDKVTLPSLIEPVQDNCAG